MSVSRSGQRLRARALGIDSHAEPMVFLHKDSPICRSEGFSSHNRVDLSSAGRHIVATLYQVDSDLIGHDEAGLSDATWQGLALEEGDMVTVHHAAPVDSLARVRGRIFGHELDETMMRDIIGDIVAGRYSTIEISAFVTACATRPMTSSEVRAMTLAMVAAGERLVWDRPLIADKHSVGGLPGNRTTPIVVAICAAAGLVMPKTSSRAITSPSGTADTMETLAPVMLDERLMRDVVEREGGCIAWGGAVNLSPADDILIRIERALDIDSEGQMIASILSKKIAAGATHLVLDMPVGPTAKVRDEDAARSLTGGLLAVAKAFGITARVVPGDGAQPVGRGIGPALEAHDVLAVLQQTRHAPEDLRDRALLLAGTLLELAGKADAEQGTALARQILEDGHAWAKFQRICEAQGGMRTPPQSSHRKTLTAIGDGVLDRIDNRRLARLAKLAGAPEDKAAGVEMHVRLGDRIEAGRTPLCTVHAEAAGELAYALNYADTNSGIFHITP